MMQKRQYSRFMGTTIAALGLAIATSSFAAGPQANREATAGQAASLMRFYPTTLASSPRGLTEEPAIWLAKVGGLINSAPQLLRQSLLMSESQQDFEANLALLEQMQVGQAQRAGADIQRQAGILKAVGGADTLAYTALSPCRLMDTRSAAGASGVQGPIAGGVLKSIPGYITAGQNWSSYGQTAPLSDCGLTNAVGANIKAVAIVITILNPNFSAFLGVSDSAVLNTVLSKVALNYTAGQGLSTMYIVPQQAANTIYFAMPAGLSAHLIFDVVGYFSTTQATALDCNTQTTAGTGTHANGANLLVSFPACTAGYTRTGLGCGYNGNLPANVYLSESTTGFGYCNWFNNSGAGIPATSYQAEAFCCRIPGR